MFDGIEYRGFEQTIVEDLAKYSKVPVWNGLTNEFHPTQMLADLLTIREHFGRIKGIRLSFYGDCRYNMANSWMVAGAKCGMHITLCADPVYFPDADLVKTCREIAAQTGGSITLESDAKAGAKDADVLYTDVWVSMGEEAKTAERIKVLRLYQINMDLMKATGNLEGQLMFLHCLPAFHDFNTEVTKDCGALEVTDEVFESKYSKVFDESENRMHTIKALLVSALCDRASL
jgi:ornithine carbamoyltransferase